MGEAVGVGDINPFVPCSPACFAPVSATELVLWFMNERAKREARGDVDTGKNERANE